MWLIYVIDDHDGEQVIRSEVVELLYARENLVYVKGALNAGDAVIAGGLHRVVAGQNVYRSRMLDLAMPGKRPLEPRLVQGNGA